MTGEQFEILQPRLPLYQWTTTASGLAVNAVTRHILLAKGINSTLGTGRAWFQRPPDEMPGIVCAIFKAPTARTIVVLLNVLAAYVRAAPLRRSFNERMGLGGALSFAVNSVGDVVLAAPGREGTGPHRVQARLPSFWNAAAAGTRARPGPGADLPAGWPSPPTRIYGLLHLGSMAIILALHGVSAAAPAAPDWRWVWWAALSAQLRLRDSAGAGASGAGAERRRLSTSSSLQLGARAGAADRGFQRVAPEMGTVLAPAYQAP